MTTNPSASVNFKRLEKELQELRALPEEDRKPTVGFVNLVDIVATEHGLQFNWYLINHSKTLCLGYLNQLLELKLGLPPIVEQGEIKTLDFSKYCEANEKKVPEERASRKVKFQMRANYPSDMARIPIFVVFPTNQIKLIVNEDDSISEVRPHIAGKLISSTPWGECRYTGPILDIYDEMYFISILHLVNDTRLIQDCDSTYDYWDFATIDEKKEPVLEKRTEPSKMFKGTATDLLKPMFGKRRPSGKDIAKLERSLDYFTGATMKQSAFRNNKRTKKQSYVANLILDLKWIDVGDDAKIQFKIHPWVFRQMQTRGQFSCLDLDVFRAIKGPCALYAKATYRFLTSLSEGFNGDFMTLCQAIAMDHNLVERKKPISRAEMKRRTFEIINRLHDVGVIKKKPKKVKKDDETPYSTFNKKTGRLVLLPVLP